MKSMESKKHILIISQYFYPEQFRVNDIAVEWIKKGYEVTVITGIPNYPQGKFVEGYGLFKKREENYKGVRVIRLPIIPRGSNGIMLVLNYLSYMISGFFWSKFTKIKADRIFIFQTSPATQALVGIWYAKRKKIPCCMYVQDLWPNSVEAITGISNPKIIGLLEKMMKYIYKNCNVILGTSPSFVQEIEKNSEAWTENGISKVKYWPQYAEEFYKPVERIELSDMPQNDKFKIVFTGNIGYAQGLKILPKVAALLKCDNANCQFIIIGDGRYRAELEKEIAENNVVDMFVLLGRKKPEEIPYYLAWCDMAFLSFADNPLFEMTIPAKLQSYMACGMPILAVAGGETKRIVKEAKCGVCFAQEDIEMIVAAILKCTNDEIRGIEDMSNAAKDYSDKNFDKANLINEIDKCFVR